MARKLSSAQIVDVIELLIGDVQPEGSTHIDNERYENLLKLFDVLGVFLDEVGFVLDQTGCEYSIKRARTKAYNFFKTWLENMNERINEYERDNRDIND